MTCTSCSAELPPGARFCPGCGAAVGPPPGPVSYQEVEPRLFGVAPPKLLLGLAIVLLAIALVLFATGGWPYGLIVLGVSALVAAAYLEAARRRPAERFVLARERAQSAVETWRVRSQAAAEVRRARAGIAAVEQERRVLLHDLGAAVHVGDERAESEIRARLTALDEHEQGLRIELEAALAHADERIRQARLPVEETMMVLPAEPTPPPGEADPPQPAVIPEPYPPPDEGTPPQPARVPEPSPDKTDD
jgi:hypothetical protein